MSKPVATSKVCSNQCCRVLWLNEEMIGNVIGGRALLARYTTPQTWTPAELRAIADHLEAVSGD